ncbi:DUF2914 domain-containing protein [Candidatus Nomurabacteria bacterium]|nr:DUF2914 domain-containing protein [Candidatus Nomurabacteria bacterium]
MRLHHLTHWYERYERWLSLAALAGGFLFDALTLSRIDVFSNNIGILIYLFIALICIACINVYENKKQNLSTTLAARIHFWLIISMQFAFGGLLGTFLILYFRSGTLIASWPFIALLIIFFAFNEILNKLYTKLVFQVGMLFISIYLFTIFLVPVIIHHIGNWVFIFSGLITIAAIALILWGLSYIANNRFVENKRMILISLASLTLIINILYFTNLIPPIPLALKETGVYHSIARTGTGDYTVTDEKQSFWRFFSTSKLLHFLPGKPIYAYSSIFSPSYLNTQVIHDWQYYDEQKEQWISETKISLSIIGGRDSGYRTYSVKENTRPGLWRVNILTPSNQLIGRMKFEVEMVDSVPELITKTL